MVTIEKFGRVTDAEAIFFAEATKDAEFLVRTFHNFNGVLEKADFINRIIAANEKIDNLIGFKGTLNSMKATLQAP